MLIVAPSVAQAQDVLEDDDCRLELQVDSNVDWRGPYGRGYDVFDTEQSFEIVTVSIRHEGRACDYFLTGIADTAADTPALSGPAGRLFYDVMIQPSGPSVLSPDYLGDQLSRVRGRFPRGAGVQTVTLYVDVPPGQFVPGGAYSGRTEFRLFEDDFGSPELADQAVLGIVVPVASALRVESREVGPGQRDLNIDLGDLSQGADHTLDFSIASNARVSTELSSANRGRLAHFANAPGIPYRVWMGGQALDLSQPLVRQEIVVPGASTTALPVRVSVDPQPGAAAGDYSDTLTITFVVDD
ncbi:hypothetical protein GRI62_09625 [Erythrobacter arachoides]|uniref:Spore coat protein U domain-containing protein n=1 Tax=Aurantiacibacter arachoides TaxID=1850444 RepID=A0A845A4M0_9SPHN|nr:hypothetical protein [Aurantiacibacter arachoides]MXO93867.1 hypothetical protein [Aurantiacibacter arachoides]